MAEQVKNLGGRPKGVSNKLRVTDFFNGDERDQLINAAKQKALVDGDKDMIKFCWEQLFGKATNRTEITGAEGEALIISFDKALKGE